MNYTPPQGKEEINMNPKAMYNLTYGLYLLSAQENGWDNGCIINTAVQVANDPVRIAVSVNKGNKTHDMILADGRFNVSAISTEADFELFTHFGMQSGRDVNKFEGYEGVRRSENGLYYLTKMANAYLSAQVMQSVDLGSHTMFIAEVTDGDVLSDAPCCTYSYYQSDIKPKPAAAKDKKRWECTVCGYIYEGDEMPDDYVCPLCRHGKEDFVELPPKSANAKKWECTVCGYIYEGDEVPDDYLCPLCKHGKEDFVEVKEGEAAESVPAEKREVWVCPLCGYEHEGDDVPAVCPLCAYVRKGWKCTVCGYTHAGDTPPAVCPLCEQGADKFVEIGE